MSPPPTFYANVISVKVNAKELVLEFASHFPDPAVTSQPELQARVVLTVDALDGLANVLRQAADTATATAAVASTRVQ